LRPGCRSRCWRVETLSDSCPSIIRSIDTPLSIDRGEVADKGSINQRAVLDHREPLVEALYAPTPDADVIMP
jgi:hypothetical protein